MPENTPDTQITITMNLEQAEAVSAALDLYTRIGLGDLSEIADLARMGKLNMRKHDGHRPVDIESIENMEELLLSAKALLGHPRNGSFGIGHQGVDIDARRAYEMKKSLDKALWSHKRPGDNSTVHSTGLTVRYTQDPAPTAQVLLPSG